MTVPAPTGGPNKRDLEAWVTSLRAVARRAATMQADDPRLLNDDELDMVRRADDLIGHSILKVFRVVDQIENPSVREHACHAIHELVSGAYVIGSCATVSDSARQALGVGRADHARAARSAQQERVAATIRRLGLSPLRRGDTYADTIRDQVRAAMDPLDTEGGYPAKGTLRTIITAMLKGDLGGVG